MPKAKKLQLSKTKWAGLLNKTLSKPRSLSQVCDTVGVHYLITKCYGVIEKKFKNKTLQQIKMGIKNQSSSVENIVLLSSRYITDLMDEEDFIGKTIYDFDLTGLAGMYFEVMELREYNDNKFAELRFYNKSISTSAKNKVLNKKKPTKPKPPVVSESDLDGDMDEEGEEDDEEIESDGDVSNWSINKSTSS